MRTLREASRLRTSVVMFTHVGVAPLIAEVGERQYCKECRMLVGVTPRPVKSQGDGKTYPKRQRPSWKYTSARFGGARRRFYLAV